MPHRRCVVSNLFPSILRAPIYRSHSRNRKKTVLTPSAIQRGCICREPALVFIRISHNITRSCQERLQGEGSLRSRKSPCLSNVNRRKGRALVARLPPRTASHHSHPKLLNKTCDIGERYDSNDRMRLKDEPLPPDESPFRNFVTTEEPSSSRKHSKSRPSIITVGRRISATGP